MASSSSSPTNTVSPATEDVESGTLEVKVSDEVDKRKLEGPQKGPKQKKVSEVVDSYLKL